MKVFTIYDKQDIYEFVLEGVVIKRIRRYSLLSTEETLLHFNDLPEHVQLAALDKIEEERYAES